MARIRAWREDKGWSQQELADRAGVSRQLVGAVEAGRHVPNVAGALSLARALGTTVEDLFEPAGAAPVAAVGGPLVHGDQVATVRVGDELVAVPLAHGAVSAEGWALPDAVVDEGGMAWLPDGATDGLVIAGCDPVLGMLEALVARTSPHRLVGAHASTGRSVAALAAGNVHGVIVHAPQGGLPAPPVPVRRWHLARWQVGIASGRRSGPPSVEELAASRPRVVQRDADAGSQQALRRALVAVGSSSPLPGPVGDGHLDVARRVRQGGARAGVTMEAAARAFGLGFTPLEAHTVELWLDRRWSSLSAAGALVGILAGASFRARAAVLGGYDLHDCGTERESA